MSNPIKAVKSAAAPRGAGDYKAGLVFVIDSTLSMQPYIKRTREAVKQIYDTLANDKLLGHVNFGLIAFRDNLAASHQPTKDYTVRTFVNLEQGRDAAGFLSRVNSLQAALFSNRDFIEDSYAGVKEAIEGIKSEVECDSVFVRDDIAEVSAVGVGMRNHYGIAEKMFSALAKAKVNIDSITTSEIRISCVVDKSQAEQALTAVCDAFDLDKSAEERAKK